MKALLPHLGDVVHPFFAPCTTLSPTPPARPSHICPVPQSSLQSAPWGWVCRLISWTPPSGVFELDWFLVKPMAHSSVQWEHLLLAPWGLQAWGRKVTRLGWADLIGEPIGELLLISSAASFWLRMSLIPLKSQSVPPHLHAGVSSAVTPHCPGGCRMAVFPCFREDVK